MTFPPRRKPIYPSADVPAPVAPTPLPADLQNSPTNLLDAQHRPPREFLAQNGWYNTAPGFAVSSQQNGPSYLANTPTAQVDFLPPQAYMAPEVDQQLQQQHFDHAQPVQWQQAQQPHADAAYSQQQIRPYSTTHPLDEAFHHPVQPAYQDMVAFEPVQPYYNFQSPHSQANTGEFAGPLQYAEPDLTRQQIYGGYGLEPTQGVLGSFPPHQGSPGIAVSSAAPHGYNAAGHGVANHLQYSQTLAQSTLPPSMPPMSPNGGVFHSQRELSLDGQAHNEVFGVQPLATGNGRKIRPKAPQHRNGPADSWYNRYIYREFQQRVLEGEGKTNVSRKIALVLSMDMRKKGLKPNFVSPDSVTCRNRRMNRPHSTPPPPLTAEENQLVAAAEAEAAQASEEEQEKVRLSWPKEKAKKKPEVS